MQTRFAFAILKSGCFICITAIIFSLNVNGKILKRQSYIPDKILYAYIFHRVTEMNRQAIFLIGPSRAGFGLTVDKGQMFSENILFKIKLDEMFPQAGQYQIRFMLDNGYDGKERQIIKSEPENIFIKEPFGIDKEAIEFLRKNQNQSLFWWKTDREKETLSKFGKSLLDVFAENFGESVFGEYAIYEKGFGFLLTHLTQRI